jgi:hypothetical protein
VPHFLLQARADDAAASANADGRFFSSTAEMRRSLNKISLNNMKSWPHRWPAG